MTRKRKVYFRNALDRVTVEYRKPEFAAISKEIEALNLCQAEDKKNKLLSFCVQNNIHSAKEITYDERCEFEAYLRLYRSTKISEYMKAFDLLKLEYIKRTQSPLETKRYTNPNEKIFLFYHPDYETAMSFYYYQLKENLVFDLSVDASLKLKQQTLDMINHIFEAEDNTKMRNERFLIPLKRFFDVCVERKVEDIDLLESEDIDAYRESIKGTVGTKENDYMQIVNNFRKFIFLNAKRANLKANLWYMERFSTDESRANAARLVGKIDFTAVKNKDNRDVMKKFEEYMLTCSSQSFQTIRCRHYLLNDFFVFLDNEKINIKDLNKKDIDKYLNFPNRQILANETKNMRVMTLSMLCEFLYREDIIEKPVNLSDSHVKTFEHHNDLALTKEELRKEMEAAKDLPYTEKLMYIVLRTCGLRSSEVCILKTEGLIEENGNTFLKTYSQKMRKERIIPISNLLYGYLKEYIRSLERKPGEYIFQNRAGGAYCCGTFVKHVSDVFKDKGLSFRSHASRHTVITMMYSDGVHIPIIREYAGHKSDEMTKQYIDYEGKKAIEALILLQEGYDKRDSR